MNRYHALQDGEPINLVSDSDEDEFDWFDADEQRPDAVDEFFNVNGMYDGPDEPDQPIQEADHDLIDLTNIPDIDVPPSDPIFVPSESPTPEEVNEDNQLVTEAIGLQMVMDFLPGISIDHVLGIFREMTTDQTRTSKKCQDIISQLVEAGDYPKEDDDANKKKRKRGDEDDWQDYETADRDPAVVTYVSEAIELLKDEFPFVPVRHIVNVVKDHKTLFKSYIVLETQVRNYGRISNKFSNIHKARNKRGTELSLIEQGSQLPKELQMAKRKVESESTKRRKAEEAEQAEAKNLEDAQKNGQMGECACCFDDVPLNRMVSCNGASTHSYCLECPKRQIETQMGMSNCRPKCFGVDNCDGTFTRKDLQLILGTTTFDRLEHLQQQQDLAAAGLDFLSECPFCDFKMECLPVDVDKEFRCQNPKCRKISCRLCNKETHIPLSCEEAAKDGQITLRHIVEEAMSAALIRQCNKCKHPFVKDHGCNKMSCSHCRNLQCYVCSKDVTDYKHFGEIAHGKCPLHDNVEDRHEQEVKNAADEAMAKVRAEHPDLSDADLMIQVSDHVKKAEEARKRSAHAEANNYPYHVVNGLVQPRPGQAAARHGLVVPPPLPALAFPAANAPAPQYVPIRPHAVFGAHMPAPVYPHVVAAPPYGNNMVPALQQMPVGGPFAANYIPFRWFAAQPQQQPQQPVAAQLQAQQQVPGQAPAPAQVQAQHHLQAQRLLQEQHQRLHGQVPPGQQPPNYLQALPPQQQDGQLDANVMAQRLGAARQQSLVLQQRLRRVHEQQEQLAQQGQRLLNDMNMNERIRAVSENERIRIRQRLMEARRRELVPDEQNE